MSEILTVRELADRFKVSDKTVRQAISTGRLPAAKVDGDGARGGVWRIALADARACFDASAGPTLKALYREFRAAQRARLGAQAAGSPADQED